jgi:hypothetical protein
VAAKGRMMSLHGRNAFTPSPLEPSLSKSTLCVACWGLPRPSSVTRSIETIKTGPFELRGLSKISAAGYGHRQNMIFFPRVLPPIRWVLSSCLIDMETKLQRMRKDSRSVQRHPRFRITLGPSSSMFYGFSMYGSSEDLKIFVYPIKLPAVLH